MGSIIVAANDLKIQGRVIGVLRNIDGPPVTALRHSTPEPIAAAITLVRPSGSLIALFLAAIGVTLSLRPKHLKY